jgi:hypothetical protein
MYGLSDVKRAVPDRLPLLQMAPLYHHLETNSLKISLTRRYRQVKEGVGTFGVEIGAFRP